MKSKISMTPSSYNIYFTNL